MPKIEKSILINAQVEQVFAFMIEPSNLLEIWPSLLEIKNVQPLPTGGFCYDWVYKMAGMHFKGQVEWPEFILNKRIVNRSEGGIPSTMVWTFQPVQGGTRLGVRVDYTIPAAVLTKFVEPVVHKLNEHEMQTILANVKACLENQQLTRDGPVITI